MKTRFFLSSILALVASSAISAHAIPIAHVSDNVVSEGSCYISPYESAETWSSHKLNCGKLNVYVTSKINADGTCALSAVRAHPLSAEKVYIRGECLGLSTNSYDLFESDPDVNVNDNHGYNNAIVEVTDRTTVSDPSCTVIEDGSFAIESNETTSYSVTCLSDTILVILTTSMGKCLARAQQYGYRLIGTCDKYTINKFTQ